MIKYFMIGLITGCILFWYVDDTSPEYWITKAQHGLQYLYELVSEEV